jgi:hypothetical protein
VRRFPEVVTSIRKMRRFQHEISSNSKVISALQAACQIPFNIWDILKNTGGLLKVIIIKRVEGNSP